ncbi:hypothetical protein JTB14_004235 [Gonioctena quinquepunctata]|nr:hypothetical protein JTB14_004235 [Gonioctena quinquepunctata]
MPFPLSVGYIFYVIFFIRYQIIYNLLGKLSYLPGASQMTDRERPRPSQAWASDSHKWGAGARKTLNPLRKRRHESAHDSNCELPVMQRPVGHLVCPAVRVTGGTGVPAQPPGHSKILP